MNSQKMMRDISIIHPPTAAPPERKAPVLNMLRKIQESAKTLAETESTLPSANILTLRTLSLLFPARMIFSNESPQYAAVSSKYFMPYTRSYIAVSVNTKGQDGEESANKLPAVVRPPLRFPAMSTASVDE